MRKLLVLLVFTITGSCLYAQKIESIHFNLYTDSLKKGFYNYINVDGKTTTGEWLPLDSTIIRFSSNAGRFNGNDLFIDSSYTADSIKVRAVVKSNPALCKEVIIYIRKRGFDEPLRSSDEILNDIRNNSRKKKSLRS
jgi:hypothetical protein